MMCKAEVPIAFKVRRQLYILPRSPLTLRYAAEAPRVGRGAGALGFSLGVLE